jgi:allantoin racemase
MQRGCQHGLLADRAAGKSDRTKIGQLGAGCRRLTLRRQRPTLAAGGDMRLLLVNGNTSPEITALIAEEARRSASPGTELVAVTPRFGPAYIATRSEAAIAAHGILAALAEHAGSADAAVIACFGEPGLAAARELLPIPVTGMAEAAMLTACMLGGRFAIVTGGARWVPMLEELTRAYGLERRLAAIRTHPLEGGAIAQDRDGAAGQLAELARRCIDEDGADCIILGGAGLAGIAARIGDSLPVPVLDGLDCAVRQAELLAAMAASKPTAGSYANLDGRASRGLDAALADRLLGGRTRSE